MANGFFRHQRGAAHTYSTIRNSFLLYIYHVLFCISSSFFLKWAHLRASMHTCMLEHMCWHAHLSPSLSSLKFKDTLLACIAFTGVWMMHYCLSYIIEYIFIWKTKTNVSRTPKQPLSYLKFWSQQSAYSGSTSGLLGNHNHVTRHRRCHWVLILGSLSHNLTLMCCISL